MYFRSPTGVAQLNGRQGLDVLSRRYSGTPSTSANGAQRRQADSPSITAVRCWRHHRDRAMGRPPRLQADCWDITGLYKSVDDSKNV